MRPIRANLSSLLIMKGLENSCGVAVWQAGEDVTDAVLRKQSSKPRLFHRQASLNYSDLTVCKARTLQTGVRWEHLAIM